MPFSLRNKIKLQIFGQPHSNEIGVVIGGLPPGESIDIEQINNFLRLRKGGKPFSTKRTEPDMPKIISGLIRGKTFGSPIACMFTNKDAKGRDFKQCKPRPSHADYNEYMKYGGFADYMGGGHFSGRMTLPLCFAGAVCMQILERRGIYIYSHILSIGGIEDRAYDPIQFEAHELTDFCVLDLKARNRMLAEIKKIALEGDSLGGVVECAIAGMPQGLGQAMFDGVESRLSTAIFGIPAVRGIDFGAGFGAANMRGSEHNDAFYYDGDQVRVKTNHAGGILGGVTTGEKILFRVAIKPTPSILIEQDTVDLSAKVNAKLKMEGRHDPCIVPRAVPCVVAAAAIVMLDFLLQG